MPRYLIDSNFWINAAHYYPIDLFPSFWETIKGLIEDGTIAIHEMVLNEINEKEDFLGPWLTGTVSFSRAKISQEGFSIYLGLCAWAENNPQYNEKAIDEFKENSRADAWICAEAKAGNFTVVTDERSSNSPNKVKIPNVCNANGIQCISNFEFMRINNFRF